MSEAEIVRVIDLHDSIRHPETRSAFFLLLLGLTGPLGLHPLPLNRGAFRSIHVATRPDATPYGEAEFAFKAAAHHLKWWFRAPAFTTGVLAAAQVRESFPDHATSSGGELTLKIATYAEAESLLAFLKAQMQRGI